MILEVHVVYAQITDFKFGKFRPRFKGLKMKRHLTDPLVSIHFSEFINSIYIIHACAKIARIARF